MIAFIPGLCPFDDIAMWLLAISGIGAWLKTHKWCKRKCECHCHEKPKKTRAWFKLP